LIGDAKVKEDSPNAVSPLVSINGTGAAKYLESFAFSQALQDRDAQYDFNYSVRACRTH